MDQPKIERMLRLMKMLTANTTYTVDQIAERLDMSRRTIYRYIDTFREAGFVIKKSGSHIRLDKESPHFKDISQLVHFTEEEAVILKRAIESIDDTNLLKQNLKRKLYSVYDNKILADTIVRGSNTANVHSLIEAIEQQRQVILKEYRSSHAGEVRDRLVEPFAFTTNYVQVWCFDTESKSCKLFKLSRIGAVEILEALFILAREVEIVLVTDFCNAGCPILYPSFNVTNNALVLPLTENIVCRICFYTVVRCNVYVKFAVILKNKRVGLCSARNVKLKFHDKTPFTCTIY